MALITPVEPGNPYVGGATDKLFSSMATASTVAWTGREILVFTTSDDLGASFVISGTPSNKTKRDVDTTIVLAAAAGSYAVFGPVPADGFMNGSGLIDIPAVANGLMMVIRPLAS